MARKIEKTLAAHLTPAYRNILQPAIDAEGIGPPRRGHGT